jgi:hypothetical protein
MIGALVQPLLIDNRWHDRGTSNSQKGMSSGPSGVASGTGCFSSARANALSRAFLFIFWLFSQPSPGLLRRHREAIFAKRKNEIIGRSIRCPWSFTVWRVVSRSMPPLRNCCACNGVVHCQGRKLQYTPVIHSFPQPVEEFLAALLLRCILCRRRVCGPPSIRIGFHCRNVWKAHVIKKPVYIDLFVMY